ncbi:hypothetical protein [Alkalihalobacterium chitinilyticum]|uniref:YitH acetyltransferase (GNAT) domain-containing protein n=1 Tax=Alkalihalobacterium chitinilyticum TaxID=2980103 RepID=A0ABT5VFQ5_9BACI|nr:hypothetical protein [Alkalihalobacterium chitinilyticum]MDE5414295.1 hypothetical protein [Alkalihalobacterium chitinilyticum]
MNKVNVKHIEEPEIEEGMNVLVESFQHEAFTSAVYDFSNAKTKELFYLLSILKAKVYFNAGHYILVATKDDLILGIAIIKKDMKIPFNKAIQMVFPDVLKAISIVSKVNWRKTLKLGKAMKHSQKF